MTKEPELHKRITAYEQRFVADHELINAKFFVENLGHYLISVAFYVVATKIWVDGSIFLGLVLHLLAILSFYIISTRTNIMITRVFSLGSVLNRLVKDDEMIPTWKAILVTTIWQLATSCITLVIVIAMAYSIMSPILENAE